MITINICKSDNGIPFVATHLDKYGYPELYFVKCYRCGAVGPFEYSEDEAIEKWNEVNDG